MLFGQRLFYFIPLTDKQANDIIKVCVRTQFYYRDLRKEIIMGLLQDWREYAYGVDINSKAGKAIWDKYFKEEKAVYEQLLANPSDVVSGTVKELADKYGMEVQYMVGFLDGINDSLKEPNPIEDMTQDTVVKLDMDLEKLYYNMVEAKAEWLYELPAWNTLLSVERRKELYLQQKKSGTIVKEKKIGRNDPCPCGSGKKYKKCCGANK